MSQDMLRGAVPEDSEGVRLLDEAIETCQQYYREAAAACLAQVRAYVVAGETDEFYGILSDASIFEELPYYGTDNDAVYTAIRNVRGWLHDHYRLLLWDRMEQQQTR